MNRLRHPFTRATYEAEDGCVRVTLGERTGLFSPDGRWLSGELREADPQLCGWAAGPRLTSRRLTRDTATEADTQRPSGR